jgi:hypothetical protein
MTRTTELAKYGLLDDDRVPTDNDLDPSGMEPGDHAFYSDYWDDPWGPGCHPDMEGYTCSAGWLHTDEGAQR